MNQTIHLPIDVSFHSLEVPVTDELRACVAMGGKLTIDISEIVSDAYKRGYFAALDGEKAEVEK